MIRPGGEPATRRWCRQEGSLATALSLVIVGLIPFELAKELCYLPLFSARDELSQSKGYCSLLRGFAAEFKNQIKKLGIKSEICGHVRLHVWNPFEHESGDDQWNFAGLTAAQGCPRRRAGVACDGRTTDAVDNPCLPRIVPPDQAASRTAGSAA